MVSLKALLLSTPLLLQAVTANWYVHFNDKGCEEPGTRTGGMTITGKDGEEDTVCRGGAAYFDSPDDPFEEWDFNSRSVDVKGISGSGLVVELYAAQGCPKESFITGIAGDDCFVSSTGDPVNYAIVRKA
ncbi:MAG: hypothetical protein Q9169_005604 [Polycauliona sp. 2 TL-2023]